jgi:hypothetical protein
MDLRILDLSVLNWTYEGLIRRPEREEWMGADKILPEGWTRPMSQIHNQRIPTRVCQGRVVTTDLPSLGANPEQPQSESETQEAKNLAALWGTRRTVRVVRADGPRVTGGWSGNENRTSSSSPRITDCPDEHYGRFEPRGLSGHPRRTVRPTSSKRKPPTRRIKTKRNKNLRRTRRTSGRIVPRRQSTCHLRTVH